MVLVLDAFKSLRAKFIAKKNGATPLKPMNRIEKCSIEFGLFLRLSQE